MGEENKPQQKTLQVILNEAKDFALGAAYEQVCSTVGFYGKRVIGKLENNMTYQSTMASLGFATGAVLDGVLIHQVVGGDTLAKYIIAGKAISIGTSLVYNQAKKITKRLQK